MTISYTDGFAKLLLRWKGSLWKSIFQDLTIFLLVYYIINFVYRFGLEGHDKEHFRHLILLFNEFTNKYPLTFLLGFYVAMIVKRWWQQFNHISYPDEFLHYVSAFIRGSGPADVKLRRLIARYTILSAVVAWRNLSPCTLKRFPTMQHVLDAKLITAEELKVLENVVVKEDPNKQWFVPLNWIQTLLVKCYEEKKFTHPNELKFLLDKLHDYRRNFLALINYNWISIPLVYTQVATIATFGYFALCLIGHQIPKDYFIHADAPKNATFMEDRTYIDIYVPIYTILQFFFYIGWLKVGEDLMHPFGEDDEDFELNYILDRHAEIAYMIVDQLYMQLPQNANAVSITSSVSSKLSTEFESELDEPSSLQLPHTKASKKIPEQKPKSHISKMNISSNDMETIKEFGQIVPVTLNFEKLNSVK